ncbi:short-chain dehydrogenase [Leucobacter sp. UCD-THU]|uniref:SDR family NAD(P)-dependent oxidoreductase n=1 Tax=Leucobacter sp. UCD-THU TaxID=1292023 RepID=UPI00037AD8F2|nr:SDR family oxidoreductase [Leucobacter sp. UCD-THU]EYT55221.1 short-chain dehydrogenase [Leucobacter sp. UCD-THU]
MVDQDVSAVPDYLTPVRSDGAAIVFGAGNGIGRQAAHALAQTGKRTICVDIDDRRARRVADEVGGIACSADATEQVGMECVIEVIETEGLVVDCVVDVIGVAYFSRVDEIDDGSWDRQLAIVVDHARRILRDLQPRLPDGATITFVSSAVAHSGGQGMAAYAAAKAALHSLVQSAAVELAERRVLVNAVSPGVVATPRMNELLAGKRAEEFARAIPLGRLVTPQEVAAVLLFVALGSCGSLTGQSIVIDGGTSARFPYPDFVDRGRPPCSDG